MPKVLNAMKSVGNLAKDTTNIQITKKKQILSDLKSAYRDMVKAGQMQVNQKIKKKSYWDRTNAMTIILELMYGKKKKLLSTVKAISVKGMRASSHQSASGFVSALCH